MKQPISGGWPIKDCNCTKCWRARGKQIDQEREERYKVWNEQFQAVQDANARIHEGIAFWRRVAGLPK